MDHYQASARRAELLIRIVSILVILASAGVVAYALLKSYRETVALFQGTVAGSLVMGSCGFLCGWIMASRRRKPQPDTHEQQRRKLVIDIEHSIAEHVLDGSWPVVMPHDPQYEPWKVIAPRELVVMANEERRRG